MDRPWLRAWRAIGWRVGFQVTTTDALLVKVWIWFGPFIVAIGTGPR